MGIVDIIIAIFGGVGGLSGLFSIFYIRINRRKALAEAKSIEIDNAQDLILEYKAIIIEYKELLCFNQACTDRKGLKHD